MVAERKIDGKTRPTVCVYICDVQYKNNLHAALNISCFYRLTAAPSQSRCAVMIWNAYISLTTHNKI